MVTVYEGAGCTGRSRGVKESEFAAGRHPNGWDACNEQWSDGTAMAYQSAARTWLMSFTVHPGFAVNTSDSCHDGFFYASKVNKHSHVTALDGCVDADYDFNYVEFMKSTAGAPQTVAEEEGRGQAFA